MCTVLLRTGFNPIAVNKYEYININISNIVKSVSLQIPVVHFQFH